MGRRSPLGAIAGATCFACAVASASAAEPSPLPSAATGVPDVATLRARIAAAEGARPANTRLDIAYHVSGLD